MSSVLPFYNWWSQRHIWRNVLLICFLWLVSWELSAIDYFIVFLLSSDYTSSYFIGVFIVCFKNLLSLIGVKELIRLQIPGNATFTSPTARNSRLEASLSVVQICSFMIKFWNFSVKFRCDYCYFCHCLLEYCLTILLICQFSLVVYLFRAVDNQCIAVYCPPLLIPVV